MTNQFPGWENTKQELIILSILTVYGKHVAAAFATQQYQWVPNPPPASPQFDSQISFTVTFCSGSY